LQPASRISSAVSASLNCGRKNENQPKSWRASTRHSSLKRLGGTLNVSSVKTRLRTVPRRSSSTSSRSKTSGSISSSPPCSCGKVQKAQRNEQLRAVRVCTVG